MSHTSGLSIIITLKVNLHCHSHPTSYLPITKNCIYVEEKLQIWSMLTNHSSHQSVLGCLIVFRDKSLPIGMQSFFESCSFCKSFWTQSFTQWLCSETNQSQLASNHVLKVVHFVKVFWNYLSLSDCVQRWANPIPDAMVGGEGGDSLEGASDLFSIPAQFHSCSMFYVAEEAKKWKMCWETGEGAAATKSLGLISILLPHGLGQRCG